MNVEIGTEEAEQFPEKEYINGIFVAMQTYTSYLKYGMYQRSIMLFIYDCINVSPGISYNLNMMRTAHGHVLLYLYILLT
jgi:hypothetical protein